MATCTSPLEVRKKDGQYVQVPCGQCLCCRRRKVASIKRFAEYEQQRYYKKGQSCSFNCLTYTPRSTPVSDTGLVTLRKTDYQKFFKRFRKRLPLGFDFKFLGCGEYGDTDGLPHYHLILFGIGSSMAEKIISKCWTTDARSSHYVPLGRIDCKPLLAGGISYVCNYVMTHFNGDIAVEKYDKKGIERPFFTHSKGLGISYLFDNLDELSNNNFTDDFSGHPFVIPRYYRDYYNLGDVNPVPVLKSIEAQARSQGLSVSDYQVQQSYATSKRALLQSRQSGLPVQNEYLRSTSGLHPALLSKIEQSLYSDDEIPF